MSAVVYEVNLHVRADLVEAVLAWLPEHVDAMLQLPGFLDARIGRERAADADAGAGATLCVHYRLRDAAALEAYLREHAPRMRADGLARFGDGFRASRRILDLLDAG